MQTPDGQPTTNGLEVWVRRLATVGVIIGGILLLAVSALVVVEIILRKFFAMSIQGVNELSSYAMAVSFAWAMPFTILHRVHIRIDVLHMILPVKLRAWLDLGSAIVFFMYMTVLAWFCALLAIASYRDNTLSSGLLSVPLTIPQGLWAFGLAAGAFTLVYLAVRAVTALRRGDYATLSRLIGTSGLPTEEIEEARHFDDREPRS
jgi:TRAP-type C4-dicarboxylate transport system permease small subunit